MNCWLISEEKAGTANQCLGLAEALGAAVTRRISPRAPWKVLPPPFWFPGLLAMNPASVPLRPPWPELLISCGRYSAGLALCLKAAARADTFAVHLQHPRINTARYDLVVAPRHDRCRGTNVIETIGSLHRVTPQKLNEEARAWEPRLRHLPRPRLAVLIGGSNSFYRLGEEEAHSLARDISRLAEKDGFGVLLTVSRRTRPGVSGVMRRVLAGCPAEIWDGSGENPYFAFLGLADAVLVTADSISMASEACSTGKPVYIRDLPGGSRKFRSFHCALREGGYARRFQGAVDLSPGRVLDETAQVAAEIRRRMKIAREIP